MLFMVQSAFAATITVLPGNGSTSTNGRAPQGSRLYVNTLYYITPSEMTTSGFGADQVSTVGWTWQAGSPQNITTIGNLKVYLQNSADLAYSKGTTFSTVGMTKVIDGTITITNSGIQFSIDVPVGGTGTSVFNTVAGQGLYVAFEYQTTGTLALPLGAPTVLCTNTVANSLGTYQSQTAYGTPMTLSGFRPETRLGNPLADKANVQSVYCHAKTPTPFGNPSGLEAKIKNESTSAETFSVTFTVQEKATATVRFTTTSSVAFTAGEVKTVSASGWNPTLQETDTVIVSVATVAGETVVSNNAKGYRHVVNADTYGYADLSASTGGVGFGTGSGQILNRHHVTGCSSVEAVKVYIFGVASIGNTVRGVVNDITGIQIGVSADHVVTAGEVDTWITLPILSPPSVTNQDVLFGLEQTVGIGGASYFPVGTQTESSPTRNLAFYSNIAGGGSLVGPYTTLNRWMIEGVITPLSTTPTVAGPTAACDGDPISFTASFTELNPAAVVNWYTDGCGTTLVGTGTTFSTTATAGTTTYYVRAEDACNGVNTACASITIVVGVSEVYFADADGDTYGDGAAAVLSCDGAPTGYVLDPTDCDDTNSSVNPGATEICDGLDNNCDGNIDEGVVSAVIAAPGGLSACKPNAVLLQTTPVAGYTYQWFKNGVLIAGAINPTYSTNKPAYYQVQVNTPEGCFALSEAVLVNIFPAPNANISAPNGTSLCTTVKLKASYDATYTWQWKLGGSDIGGATNYIYYPTGAGSYTCVVTSAEGCSRETASINVTACREGDVISGVNTISVYPNPSSGAFTLEIMAADEFTGMADVYVMNMIGEVVHNSNIEIHNGYINNTITLADDIAGGLYLVKVMANGHEYTQQVVITR
jgi:hypothetical protein